MDCLRKPQLDKRRRRVLRDDNKGSGRNRSDQAVVHSDSVTIVNLYTDAALTDGQPRITDFIPKRLWTLLVILLGGITIVVGIETLYACRTAWASWLDREDLVSLDLAGHNSLASWLSASILLCAAVYALVVFSIRRHRIDDYRGRYGLWLWAATGCLVASIDTIASLHRIIRATFVTLTETPLLGDGSIWWISAAILSYSLVSIRVWIDMRACIGAHLMLLLTTTCYGLACLIYLGWMPVVDDVATTMIKVGLLLSGHLMLLFSFLLYARYIYREAEGQSSLRGTRNGRLRLLPRWRQEDATSNSDDSEPEDISQAERRQRMLPSAALSTGSSNTVEEDHLGEKKETSAASERQNRQATSCIVGPDVKKREESATSHDIRLTKAERRRQRRQLLRQRNAA